VGSDLLLVPQQSIIWDVPQTRGTNRFVLPASDNQVAALQELAIIATVTNNIRH
jgi:hypothetical protein